jgi:hypothetical protein
MLKVPPPLDFKSTRWWRRAAPLKVRFFASPGAGSTRRGLSLRDASPTIDRAAAPRSPISPG